MTARRGLAGIRCRPHHGQIMFLCGQVGVLNNQPYGSITAVAHLFGAKPTVFIQQLFYFQEIEGILQVDSFPERIHLG